MKVQQVSPGIINKIKSLIARVGYLKSDIGIVEDTDTATHTISSGQYVIWKNELYKASTAIPSGDPLSSTNLTAVSDGIANELNSNICTQQLHTVTPETNDVEIVAGGYYQIGALVIIELRINKKITGQVGITGFPTALSANTLTMVGMHGTSWTSCPTYMANTIFGYATLYVSGSQTDNTIRICGCYIADLG